MILTGAALGGLGAATGFEPSVAKGVAGSILKREGAKEATDIAMQAVAKEEIKKVAARGPVKQAAIKGGEEFTTEALQGGQEKLAENIALRREGYDVPLMRGVIAQGVLEGVAGLGLGASAGAVEGQNARQQYAALGQQQLNDNEIKIINAPLTEKEKPKGIDLDFERVKGVATDLVSAGVSPENAREMAIEIVTEEIKADADAEAETKGIENVTEPITSTGGEGVSVAGQPREVAPTTGAGEAVESGVVPIRQDVTGAVDGEATKPTALTPEQIAKRNELLSKENMFMDEEPKEEPAPPASPKAETAPITVVETKTIRNDGVNGTYTKVKISDGSEY